MLRVVSIGLLAVCAGWAQMNVAARGHWKGELLKPNGSVPVEVDLDQTPKGWIGSLALPAVGASGLALDSIALVSGQWTFRVKGEAGEPTFRGTVSADGTMMAGEYRQGPGAVPFRLNRTGEPKVVLPKSSPPFTKAFLGSWEGTLHSGAMTLHLVLKFSNADGAAKAVLVSLDQGGAEIPVPSVEQKNTAVSVKIPAIGAEFQGGLAKAGTELAGSWIQGGNKIPLKFTKMKS